MTQPLPQQLDIFAHAQDVMRRNEVLQALEQQDAPAAGTALARLAADYPEDADLPVLGELVSYLQRFDDRPFADHDALAAARADLDGALGSAARRAWGADAAAAWLRQIACRLARRAAGLAFNAGRADDHAAALWLRGHDWRAAEDAVKPIESWRRIPAPLHWMAESLCRQGRLDESWPLLAELAWIAPARLDAVLLQAADPLLARLRRDFLAGFEGAGDRSDLAWFPAWVLIARPALAPHLALAQPSLHQAPERAMRLLVELLGLERQGRQHDLVARRRALRDLNEALFAAYMAGR